MADQQRRYQLKWSRLLSLAYRASTLIKVLLKHFFKGLVHNTTLKLISYLSTFSSVTDILRELNNMVRYSPNFKARKASTLISFIRTLALLSLILALEFSSVLGLSPGVAFHLELALWVISLGSSAMSRVKNVRVGYEKNDSRLLIKAAVRSVTLGTAVMAIAAMFLPEVVAIMPTVFLISSLTMLCYKLAMYTYKDFYIETPTIPAQAPDQVAVGAPLSFLALNKAQQEEAERPGPAACLENIPNVKSLSGNSMG